MLIVIVGVMLDLDRHTMSGSILMDASQKKGNKRGKASPNRGKVDSRLNMGSGLLNDDADVKYVLLLCDSLQQ